jgi:hypothetical protein
MTTIPDRLLRQYLAGALEPPEQARIERALAGAPEIRERLALLLATSIDEPEAAWHVPPPSLAVGLRSTSAPAAMMDAAGGGGWLVVWLEAGDDRLDHRVLVLERAGAGWEVVFPSSAEELVTVGALPREGGRTRLDLDPGAARRVAVVLVPPDLQIDFGIPADARWSGVQEGLRAGELPVVSLDTP